MCQKSLIGLFATAVLVLGTAQVARADANYAWIQAAYTGVPATIAPLVAHAATVTPRADHGSPPLLRGARARPRAAPNPALPGPLTPGGLYAPPSLPRA